jgi:MtrB/PioB family decaheme-associated outer membrane protein
MTTKPRLLGTAIASAFLVALGFAEDAPPKGTGAVTVGAQGGSGINDSSKLQQYETVPIGVFLEDAHFFWKSRSNYFIDFKSTKLGLDDQFARLDFGKPGSFQLFAGWDQNPNWMSNTARTPYTEISPGVFHVPDGMRQALQNVYVPWIPGSSSNPIGTGSAPANPTVPGYFAVEPWVAQAPPIDLRYLRRTGSTGLEFASGENWTFKVGYANELRDGNKNTTFSAGSYNMELATPIDYTTHSLHGEAEFAKGRFVGAVSADFSKFLNDIRYATVDNAERLELFSPITKLPVYNDVETFRLWLPPDNQAYTVAFNGALKLGDHNKLTAALATGSMSMDQDLVPLSSNPYLQTSATEPNPNFTIIPPYPNIAAKYGTFLGYFKFSGDPTTRFGYSASYRNYQLNDKTQAYNFTSLVRNDTNASYKTGEDALVRDHQGYSMQSAKAEIHFLPVVGLRLGAGVSLDKRDFDQRRYEDVDDRSLSLLVDYNRDRLALHGGYTYLKREPGTLVEAPPWEGATQTDISHRGRNIWNGLLTLMPTDKFAISFTGYKQSNDFWEAVTGLLDQSGSQLGVDFTYSPNAKWSGYAGYVYEKSFFNMAAAYIAKSSPFDPANLWENNTTDRVDTYRAGFKWDAQPDKLSFVADLNYSRPRSDSLYDFALPGTPIEGLNEANGIFPANVPPIPGFPVTSYDRFPQVSKNFLILKLSLDYRIAKDLTATALYWKQKFDNVDWQTQTVTPYMGHVDPGANRWFFLGAQVPSYDANIFRVSLSYRF